MYNFSSSPCCLIGEKIFLRQLRPALLPHCTGLVVSGVEQRLGVGGHGKWGDSCILITNGCNMLLHFHAVTGEVPIFVLIRKWAWFFSPMGKSKKTITYSVIIWNEPVLFSCRKKENDSVMECWTLAWRKVSDSGYLFSDFSFVQYHYKTTGYDFQKPFYLSGSRTVSGLFAYDL